jgi:kynurenine formamidase/ribulose-5-phosphate 4-epimerase/fuculose-1-phosphate aldolase
MGLVSDHDDVAQQLCRYSKLCYERVLATGSGGNLSVRVPGTEIVLVTASGIALRDIAPGNIVVVDVHGQVIEAPAGLKPSKEIGFHLEVFRKRPAVNAVIHVHPAHAIVLASRRSPIPLATISAQLKLKQGPIVPDAPPGSPELCEHVARCVAASGPEVSVLLMERHGLIAFDVSLGAAFDDAELAAETAKIGLLMESPPALASLDIDRTEIVELSVRLSNASVHYPTDPAFRLTEHTGFAAAGAYVSRIEMGSHIGTHVDAPLHVRPGAPSISALPVSRFLGHAVAMECLKSPGQDIGIGDIEAAHIRAGDIVIFRTGWEERAGSPRFFEGEWPGFSREAAVALVARGVKAVGLDTPSADGPAAIAAGFASHKLLLDAGIPIFEALVNLRRLIGRRFFFIGLPLGIDQGEASPVRAVALLDAAGQHEA